MGGIKLKHARQTPPINNVINNPPLITSAKIDRRFPWIYGRIFGCLTDNQAILLVRIKVLET